MYKVSMNIPLQVFMWTHVFSFLAYILRVESLDHCFIYFGGCILVLYFSPVFLLSVFPWIEHFAFILL